MKLLGYALAAAVVGSSVLAMYRNHAVKTPAAASQNTGVTTECVNSAIELCQASPRWASTS